MSVITQQTLILKTCGDYFNGSHLSGNESSENFNASAHRPAGENAAFLNFTLSAGKAEIKITFIKPLDLKNALLVFEHDNQLKIFDLADSLKSENNARKFNFTAEPSPASDQNGSEISALVVCNGFPTLFAFNQKKRSARDFSNFNGFSGDKNKFKELLSYYEKNYKTNDVGAEKSESNVFRQKENRECGKTDESTDSGNGYSARTDTRKAADEHADDLSDTEAQKKQNEKYDDEAVATENYYAIGENEILISDNAPPEKIPLYKADEAAFHSENSQKTPLGDNDKEKENDLQINEDARTFNCDKQCETQKENESRTYPFEIGTDGGESESAATESVSAESSANACISKTENEIGDSTEAAFTEDDIKITAPFYYSVKEEIESLFEKYPHEYALEELIPNSRWVKIDYGGGKSYVAGVIEEKGVPAHIVYGIKGNRIFKPRAASDYSLFFPVSRFILGDEGYWCMFQSAKTGETEKF